MANDAEASTPSMQRDQESESQEVALILPQRFWEIHSSSEATQRFNLMNDDIISKKKLPAVDRHRRHHIRTDCSGQVAQRIRRCLGDPRRCPRSDIRRPALLFSISGLRYLHDDPPLINRLVLYDCALRDKRLAPLPNRIWERSATLPEPLPALDAIEKPRPFLEAVGQKVVLWTSYDPYRPFTYIMTADHNLDWNFRTLDTSTICREIGADQGPASIKHAIVGDRLIVVLLYRQPVDNVYMRTLVLDVNTEMWSLLPHVGVRTPSMLAPFSWKGKLHFIEVFSGHIMKMYFDFEMNMWLEDILRSVGWPSIDLPSSFISSRSGTLYAVIENSQRPPSEEIHVYSMNDVRSGWNRIELQESVHTQQYNPFACLPTDVNCTIRLWEINEHDILLVFFKCTYGLDPGMMKYSWWIFNHHDGIKSYGREEFDVKLAPLQSPPLLLRGVDAICMKIES